MAVNFPGSPTNNQTFTSGGITWIYSTAIGAWKIVPNTITGSQGIQGLQGIQGISNQGIQGIQGIQSIQGLQGIQGTSVQGLSGTSQGIQGAQGPQGLQGQAGTSQGIQGLQGANGFQGIQGIQSIQGLQGTLGSIGLSSWTPVMTGGVTQSSSVSSTFTKSTGNNLAWDGQVYSQQGYVRGVYTSARASQANLNVVFGLNSDPATDGNYTGIDYAFSLSTIGTADIYESGTLISTLGTYDTTMTFTITYDGVNVRYYRDGTLLRTVARAIGNPLYFDSSFFNIGTSINTVLFGPMGEAGGAIQITATDDTSTGTLYPVMVGAAGSSQTPKVTTSKLTFNASTGALATPTAVKNTADTTLATTGFAKALFYTASTSGNTDWNSVTNITPGTGETLLLGTGANGPGQANYYHPVNFNYSALDSTGQVTQLAVSYASPANELYMRGRYTGTWSSWVRFLNTANSPSIDIQFRSLGVNTPASGTAGQIRATDNITAYYSDRRLKTDIKLIDNALDKVNQISGVTFKSNEEAAKYGYTDIKTQVGVIAQEIEAVLPEVVVPAPFDIGKNEDGTEYSKSGQSYNTVQYEKLVPLLIEAIKEMSNKIDNLEGQIEVLKNK